MSETAIREPLLGAVDTHPDFTEIEHDEYMDTWDGSTPVYDLLCETDDAGGFRVFINPVNETGAFVASVTGGLSDTKLSVQYRITPETDIETSLEAFEQGGFEHFTPEPPRPGEDPLQTVFEAIKDAPQKPADEATDSQAVFDGSYQCRDCGTVRQIGTFAGAATPPKQVGTDCPTCGGERQFYGIAPDGEPVRHRWYVNFEDIYQDPPYLHVTATSRKAARTQIETEYPDRTIEVLSWVEARV
jgi:rubrerythrin